MIPATTNFYNLTMDGELSHDGSPVLSRHLRNSVMKADAAGSWITRANPGSTAHIDMAVATIIGLHRATLWREEETSEPEIFVL